MFQKKKKNVKKNLDITSPQTLQTATVHPKIGVPRNSTTLQNGFVEYVKNSKWNVKVSSGSKSVITSIRVWLWLCTARELPISELRRGCVRETSNESSLALTNHYFA